MTAAEDPATAADDQPAAAGASGAGAPGEQAGAPGEPVRVVDNPDRRRFEMYLGDTLAGFAMYRLAPGEIAFTHTEVAERFNGRGLGSRLAAAVLDEARRRGSQVVPLCPFIAGYIRQHPEYADLVAAGTAPSDS